MLTIIRLRENLRTTYCLQERKVPTASLAVFNAEWHQRGEGQRKGEMDTPVSIFPGKSFVLPGCSNISFCILRVMSVFLFFPKMYLLSVNECVSVRMYLCALCVCLVSMEAGRGNRISWNQTCGWLWTIICTGNWAWISCETNKFS